MKNLMPRIAWRSLASRPVRAAVLAVGFGFGVAVMAELLGVGAVMLEQSRSPALRGGGDLVLAGPFGSIPSARYVMSSLLAAPDFGGRVAAMSPSTSARLYLMTAEGPVAVNARGGVPSMEKALGDPEVLGVDAWRDRPGDERWAHPAAGDVLRAMDRFHAVPQASAYADSWAEWLYFNGRTADGRLRLYLTFLVGPQGKRPGMRQAGVRLQLRRDGRVANYSAQGEVDERALLAHAPDLDIAGNRVTLDGLRYRTVLSLGDRVTGDRLTGELTFDAAPNRALPPVAIRGANGWLTGYVVPALSAGMAGQLTVGREVLAVEGTGYHDHNWGFWKGVSWQWGQVASQEVSIVYGRVFPPSDVADPSRVRGFLVVTGQAGPLAFSTDVTIDDADPARVTVRARGRSLDLRLTLNVKETVRTSLATAALPMGGASDFLQLGGTFEVRGTVRDRELDFSAAGAAETFKPAE
jgi:hypothetical protein